MRATLRDPELQSQFERDGYITLSFLNEAQVDQLRLAFEEVGSAPGDPHLACHSSFHSSDRDYKVAVDASVRAVFANPMAEHLDRQRALPCNFIVKWPAGSSGFGLHQDLSLVDERLHRSAEVWVALDDTNAKNGQLWMVPGSHRWTTSVRGISAFPFPFVEVSERIVRRHAQPVPVPAGHAVIFNHATLHFSMPNRTDAPRRVAITDIIPEEAEHLHFFGDGSGNVGAFAIDDEFWTSNNPFSLTKPPANSRYVGAVARRAETVDDDVLDRLVASGQASDTGQRPSGSINTAHAWCHRCGSQNVQADSPHRLIGNVTLLCEPCRTAEDSNLVATPATV